ncbi:MAG: TonB-dependent receptor [Bacteroidetes bacterium]|nr:TonB-dependent receptor [Bacteroidota bacterium]
MYRKILSTVLLTIISLLIVAQSGTLRGKIIDGETGEELIGATVMIMGTSIGAASDLDGNYTVINLEPGTYDFTCQFISYDATTIKEIVIKEDEVTLQNFSLGSVSMGLDEVVISAKAVTRSETAMLSIQKKSANVVDGLSSQQMKRAGDSDAAGALKRVSGINIEGGKYVFVRGLSDRYSKTTLNGADIPGLDPNKNTVQMDIFPTNLIENMIVYKSYTPNLPADFTGGLIDIVTLDFPETFTLSFSVKAGYNSQASFNSNFLSYEGSGTDLFGYDNGLRDIPSDATGEIPVYPSDKQGLTNITSSFNKVMAPTTLPSSMNSSYSFSVGNQYAVGKNSIGYVVGLSYKYEEEYYDNATYGSYKLGGAEDEKLITQYKYKATQGQKESLWGALANISYKIGLNHKISFNVFKNQSGKSQALYTIGPKPSDEIGSLLIESRKLLWLQRGFTSGQLRGEHYFEKASKLKVTWIGSYTKSKQDEPDMRFFKNSYYPDNEEKYTYAIEPSIYKVPARFYRNMKEDNLNIKVNAAFDLGKSENAPKLQFGSAYSYKTRDFDEKRVDYKFQFASNTYNGNVTDFLSDDNIGLNYPGYNPNTGSNFGLYIQGNPGDDIKNSYTANQSIIAGYTMIDANLSDKFRVVTGIRYEQTVINSASKDSTSAKGYLNNSDFLPALNLTWFANNKMNVRLNISRTLARPSFRELAPYASEDYVRNETEVGNPNLKRSLIDNLDLKYEYYITASEIASFGLFAKRFTDPIEVVENTKAVNSEISWDNMDQALVYGFELDIRKNLDFIKPLRHFKFGINFTYVYSEVGIDSVELSAIRATDPSAKDTRPMQGQSPYILNASFGYQNRDIGLDINTVYNVTGPKLIINVKGGTPDIYQQPFNSLNLVASKTISSQFIMSFKATNLLNPAFREIYTFNDQEYISREYTLGRVFEIGIKYQIK